MDKPAHGSEPDNSESQARRLRLIIADDRPRTRDALRALLTTRAQVEVIGEAADGQEAVRLVEERRPDAVLMDVRMPGMDGLKATQLIKGRWPEVKVIVLTLYTTHRAEALAAGADAFVNKGDPPGQLLATLSQLG